MTNEVRRRLPYWPVLPAVAASLFLAAGNVQAQAPDIGIASAVNPDATGTPPGMETRVIEIGKDVFHRERVVTDTNGRAQLLFVDGTALTIGANSEVTLDEFVYDPVAKDGKLAFSAAKGVFRLVGGKLSKKNPVLFRTPDATIGIRGGIGLVSIELVDDRADAGAGLTAGTSGPDNTQVAQATPRPRTRTVAQLGFGRMTVTAGGITRNIRAPGFQVTASGNQAPPSQPALAQDTGGNLQKLEGTGDNTGGAPKPPTNEDVANTQLSTLGSQQPPTQLSTASTAPRPAPPPPAPPANRIEQNVRLKFAQQNTVLDSSTGGSREGIGTSFSYGGRYLSNTPYTNFDFNTSQTTKVASRNRRFKNGKVTNGFFNVDLGALGTLKLPARKGDFSFTTSGTQSPFGPVLGTGFGSDDLRFFYWNLKEANHTNNRASAFAGVPFTGAFPTSGIRVHDLVPGFPGNNKLPLLPLGAGGNLSGARSPKLLSAYSPNVSSFPDDRRSVALYASVAIDGVAGNQKSAMVTYLGSYFSDNESGNKVILSGFSRGSVRTSSTATPLRVDGGGGATSRDADGNSFFGNDKPDYFVLSSDVTQGGTGTIYDAAGFTQTIENPGSPASTFFQETYAKPAATPAKLGVSRTSRQLNGYISGLVTRRFNGAISTYIGQTLNDDTGNFSLETNATTNRATATVKTHDYNENAEQLVIEMGQLTGSHRSRSAFIDDDFFGLRDSTQRTSTVGGNSGQARVALVSSGFVNPTILALQGTTLCQCQYVQWGLMSGEVRSQSVDSRHRFHLTPWVAGAPILPSVAAGLTGSATYSGHVMANIQNGSQQYVAFSNYTQSWNFGSRTGSANISNLDGTAYTASSLTGVSGTTGARFQGTLSGGGRTGNITGAFMAAGTDSAGELGAQFHVTGGGYTAAGIAAARKN